MLKLDSFDLREVNLMKVLIMQAVDEEITDVRMLQKKVDDYISNKHRQYRQNDQLRKDDRKAAIRQKTQKQEHVEAYKQAMTRAKPLRIELCPSCGEERAGLYYMPSCQRASMGGNYSHLAQCDCGWSAVYEGEPEKLVK
jgi:hypothetical protein